MVMIVLNVSTTEIDSFVVCTLSRTALWYVRVTPISVCQLLIYHLPTQVYRIVQAVVFSSTLNDQGECLMSAFVTGLMR